MNANSCVHYDGILGGDILDKKALSERRCKAGILYADVKEMGQRMTIPCVDRLRGTRTCPLHEYPTPEQLAENEREINEHIAKLWAVQRGELKECLECGAAVESYKEVRPCVYAIPCGHRQWKGQAPKQ